MSDGPYPIYGPDDENAQNFPMPGDNPVPPHDVTDAENMDAAWLFDRDFGTAGMEDDSDDIEYVEYDWDDDSEYGNTVYHGLDDEDDDDGY